MKKIKNIVLTLIVISCLGMSSLSATAADDCKHPSVRTYGTNISSWWTSHRVLDSIDKDGEHYVTCYIYNWVERITHSCSYCGYEIGHEDFIHVNHGHCN